MEKIQKGMIIKCTWNGMSDFYEVIGLTEKTVTLRELYFDFCEPQDDSNDPTYSWVKIYRDENRKPIPATDFFGKEQIHCKRLIHKNGEVTFKSPNYNGVAKPIICESDYAKMYWG